MDDDSMAVVAEEPLISAMFRRASRWKRFLVASVVLLQGLFCLAFFSSRDVSKITTVWLVILIVSTVLFVAAIVIVALSAQRELRLMVLCLFGASFGFNMLFASWLQLFSTSAAIDLELANPIPGLQARVLSGFVILLVYSSDVFEALHNVHSSKSTKDLLPICGIVALLVAVSLLQRVLVDIYSGELVLYFEVTLTTLIMLMHLFSALLSDQSRLVYLTVAVCWACLAALGACFVLVVFNFENIADVIHRCVDVILLLESHLSRVSLMRGHVLGNKPMTAHH